MDNYQIKNKVFVKSNNSTNKINLSYGNAIIIYIVLVILTYLFTGYKDLIMPLVKALGVSLLSASLIQYIINIFRKKYNILDIYLKDYAHVIGLTVGIFAVNQDMVIILVAVFISLLIKTFYKGINICASLFGILLILVYSYYIKNTGSPLTEILNTKYDMVIENYDGIKGLLVGSFYINPLISIVTLIYLFIKKSLKYPIVVSYLLTFSIIIFFYGLIKGDHIWYLFFHLACGNILFFSAFLLTNHMLTPTIKESSVIYGIILGIISAILRFITPELAIVIPLIVAPIVFTKCLDNVSPKLKQRKIYYLSLVGLFIITALVTTGLVMIF